MCGYCVEQGILLPYLAVEYSQDLALIEQYLADWQDGYLVSVYLLESNHIELLLKTVHDRNIIAHGIDIVFCRLYERFVLSGYDHSFYTSLMSYFDSADVDAFYTKQFDRAALDSFYSRQCLVDSETPLKALWTEKTFTKHSNWNSFIADKQILASSVAKLEAYHDWWILEHGKEENDPETQMKELGYHTCDSNPTRGDSKRFDLEFPSTFFAFCYVAKYSPQSDIIEKIALDGLPNCPSLGFARDLWLQRKAFLLCVNEYGMAFILEHADSENGWPRAELIYYALLKSKNAFSADELSNVRKLIRDDGESEKVLEFIDTLIASAG